MYMCRSRYEEECICDILYRYTTNIVIEVRIIQWMKSSIQRIIKLKDMASWFSFFLRSPCMQSTSSNECMNKKERNVQTQYVPTAMHTVRCKWRTQSIINVLSIKNSHIWIFCSQSVVSFNTFDRLFTDWFVVNMNPSMTYIRHIVRC
jgi:hypothetical protein